MIRGDAPLKKGDLVTWVSSWRRTARGDGAEDIGVAWTELAQQNPPWLPPSEEGITWIRGHHEPGSPEGKALMVAYALGAL